jgi:antirestriction protein ArdC
MISGKPYRGVNVFLLASQGYGSRYWLTYQQAAKLGGHVKRGQNRCGKQNVCISLLFVSRLAARILLAAYT